MGSNESTAMLSSHPFKAQVAGAFYPSRESEVRETVKKYIENAEKIISDNSSLLGVVSPHAGYVYSGRCAGYAFKALEDISCDIVVVMSPSHQYRDNYGALLARPAYRTPLGELSISTVDVTDLAQSSFLNINENLFIGEHALEVQLPFLQYYPNLTPIVPIIVPTHSRTTLYGIAEALHSHFAKSKRRVLYVASSDMSHFKPYKENNETDQRSFEVMQKMDSAALIEGDHKGAVDLCGLAPVAVLWRLSELAAEEEVGAKPVMTVLKHENSGDTSGDKSGVVGYGAVAVEVKMNK